MTDFVKCSTVSNLIVSRNIRGKIQCFKKDHFKITIKCTPIINLFLIFTILIRIVFVLYCGCFARYIAFFQIFSQNQYKKIRLMLPYTDILEVHDNL